MVLNKDTKIAAKDLIAPLLDLLQKLQDISAVQREYDDLNARFTNLKSNEERLRASLTAQAIRDSSAEAQTLVTNATAEAKRLVDEATEAANKLRIDAQIRANELVAAAQAQADTIHHELEGYRAALRKAAGAR